MSGEFTVNGGLKTVCPVCSAAIDFQNLEPFTRANCPSCQHEYLVPMLVDSYLLEDCLSQNGVVYDYKAMEISTGKPVRVQKLNAAFYNVFRRQAEFPKLEFPGAVKYLDTLVHNHELYVISEHIGGSSIREFITDEGIEEESIILILFSTARIMAAASNSGVNHGYLTPDSIKVDENGEVRICDFMLHQNILTGHDNSAKINHIFDVRYLANHSLYGNSASEKTDLFSLGVCLYEMITGETPNNSKTLEEIIAERNLTPFSKDYLMSRGVRNELIITTMGLLNNEFTCFKEVREFVKQKFIKSEGPTKGVKKDKSRTKVTMKKKKPSVKLPKAKRPLKSKNALRKFFK